MKIGDLVKVNIGNFKNNVGLIVGFTLPSRSLEKPHPIILIDGKKVSIGTLHIKVISQGV